MKIAQSAMLVVAATAFAASPGETAPLPPAGVSRTVSSGGVVHRAHWVGGYWGGWGYRGAGWGYGGWGYPYYGGYYYAPPYAYGCGPYYGCGGYGGYYPPPVYYYGGW